MKTLQKSRDAPTPGLSIVLKLVKYVLIPQHGCQLYVYVYEYMYKLFYNGNGLIKCSVIGDD